MELGKPGLAHGTGSADMPVFGRRVYGFILSSCWVPFASLGVSWEGEPTTSRVSSILGSLWGPRRHPCTAHNISRVGWVGGIEKTKARRFRGGWRAKNQKCGPLGERTKQNIGALEGRNNACAARVGVEKPKMRHFWETNLG